MAAYETQCRPSGAPVAIVMHPGCYSTLMNELRISSAPSMGISGTALPASMGGFHNKGTLFGATILVTDCVAASTTGRSNAIVPMGDGISPLSLAVWTPVSAVPLGPTDRATDRTLMLARYGVVCSDPSAGVEMILAD
jgi:hypothetical protein